MQDVIIIGSGPAGVSAALYIQRGGFQSLIIGKDTGALHKAEKIENYYGLGAPVSGVSLAEAGVHQAEELGAVIQRGEVLGVQMIPGGYEVATKDGVETARAVLLATGTSRAAPRIPGLKELEGKGVSYCAVCDAFFYRGKEVGVLGSGSYAVHEGMELLPLVKKVTLFTNGMPVTARLPQEFDVVTEKVSEIQGNPTVSAVILENGETVPAEGLFVAVGTASSSDLARKLGAQMNGRNLMVDEEMRTNLPGLFAAGDCTGGMLQVAKAVYEGAKAGSSIVKYLRS